MTTSIKYLLDADSFIRAKRDHYGFDFCPGFWTGVLKAHEKKRVASILPVRKELLAGGDDLADWVKDKCPSLFFKKVDDVAVHAALNSIADWVMKHQRYTDTAKQKFLAGADPILIAYAKVNDYVITSYEVAAPESKAKVKLPDVATEFSVACCQPFDMLREPRVRLRLASNSFK